jgi:hypothetical protein
MVGWLEGLGLVQQVLGRGILLVLLESLGHCYVVMYMFKGLGVCGKVSCRVSLQEDVYAWV